MQKNKKLTIAIVMQSPDMGGAETYMLSLISSFLRDGERVIVASNKEKFLDHAQKFPIKTYTIPFILDIMGNLRGLIKSILLFPWAIIFYSRLLLQFRKEKVDVILMSNFSEKLFVSFLTLFIRIPVVWIEYGRMETIFKRNFYIPGIVYILLQRIPKKILVPSKNTFDSLATTAKVSQEKLLLFPLGIPFTEKKRQKHAGYIIGNVSRATREKGQDYLIKAMVQVHKEIPSVHLFVIGDGPDKEYYRDLVKELQLEKYVTVTGFVKDVSDYYTKMDVFVFPTVWELEGFGLVVPEAMSYGLPVVATKTGPVPEIVDDGVTGIIVHPKDEKALAKAIITLYKNKKMSDTYGANGYKKAKKMYNLETVSKDMVTVLRKAIANE